MSKRKKVIIGIVCIFLIVAALALFLLPKPSADEKYYIFSEIDECENIEKNKHNDAEIVRYDSPQEDKDLKNCEYHQFYAADYIASELRFEIFAYEFVDSDTAKQYFNNVTGKNSEIDKNFSVSVGLGFSSKNYRLIFMDGENVCKIISNSKYVDVLPEFLAKNFSIPFKNAE